MDELIKAVRSLLADIESMQGPHQEGGGENWFGPFSESYTEGDDLMIEWPNLAISAAAVKKALENIKP